MHTAQMSCCQRDADRKLCQCCSMASQKTLSKDIGLSAQVGVTAMLIASKYEEIWAPEVGSTHLRPCLSPLPHYSVTVN